MSTATIIPISLTRPWGGLTTQLCRWLFKRQEMKGEFVLACTLGPCPTSVLPGRMHPLLPRSPIPVAIASHFLISFIYSAGEKRGRSSREIGYPSPLSAVWLINDWCYPPDLMLLYHDLGNDFPFVKESWVHALEILSSTRSLKTGTKSVWEKREKRFYP